MGISSFSACTAAAEGFYATAFIQTLSPLCFYALGSEEGAVFPPIPWGVLAPCCLCLHGGHVALPFRVHHYLHCASQVRDVQLNCSFLFVCCCFWYITMGQVTHFVCGNLFCTMQINISTGLEVCL